MNELNNASGSVSTRASLWVLCTICILVLGLGYLSAALLPAASPVEKQPALAEAPAASVDAAPIADVSVAPPAASQPAPMKAVQASAPAAKQVASEPVLLAQASPTVSVEQKKSQLVPVDSSDVDSSDVVGPTDSLVPAGRQPEAKNATDVESLVPAPQVESLTAADTGKNPSTLSTHPLDAQGDLELPPQVDAVGPNPGILAPGNDQCSGAVVIPNSFPSITAPVDISTATTTGDPGAFCATTVQSVWYSFVPTTTGSYRFTTCPSFALGGTAFNSVISVWRATGTCTGFTRIMCDDQDLGCPGNSNPSNGYITLTAGVQYYVVAGAFSTVSAGTNVVIYTDFMGPQSADSCTSTPAPAALTADRTIVGSLNNLTNDYTITTPTATCFPIPTGGANITSTAPGRDAVYSFTAPATGRYSFKAQAIDNNATTTSSTTSNLMVYTSTTCPAPSAFACTAAINAANRRTSTTTWDSTEEVYCQSITAGSTVYVIVDEVTAATSGGSYTLEVSTCNQEAEVNDTPAGANAYACGVEGTITPATDADFYSLGTPTSGSRVFSITDGVAANNIDFDERVTNATDTLEYDNGDDVTPWGSTSPNISGRPLTGVASYIRINAAAVSEPYRNYTVIQPPGAGLGGSSATPEVNDATNNQFANANTSSNNFYSGVITATTDADVYRFCANQGDVIQVNMDGDPLRDLTPMNGAVGMYDFNGLLLLPLGLFDDATVTSSNASGVGVLTATTPNSPGESETFRARYTGVYYAAAFPGVATPNTGDYLYSIAKNCRPGSAESVDLSVTKGDTPDPVIAGSNITYTIVVSNAGPDIALDAKMIDVLPGGTKFVSLTGTGTGGSFNCVTPAVGATGTVTCTASCFASGGSFTFTLTVKTSQCAGNGTIISNTATVSSTTTESNAANNSALTTTTVSDPGTCDDGNPCTIDVCSGGVCVSSNLCEDNNACTTDICDGQGGCTNTPIVCNDNNVCTDDSCNPASGCVFAPNTGPCTDGNVCTLGDACSGGVCVPGPAPTPFQVCNTGSITINDVAPASPYPSAITVSGRPPYICSTTVDLKGVTHTFIADVDVMVSRATTPNLIVMSDVGGSTGVSGVNLTLSDAAAIPLPAGAIVSGTYKPTNIGAGDPFATPAPTPSAATAFSTFTGTNPNGVWNLWVVDDATGDTGTIGGGWCVNVASICQNNADCDDSNSCTDDVCTNGSCGHTPNTGASCNDGSACTSADTCVNGTCTGTPTVCNDNDVCTTDACNPADGLCVFTPVVCNDGNSCTDDVCISPSGGCTYTNNNGNTCSDNNGCTQTDSCVDGTCVGSNPVVCDDGNVCTTDACAPATGTCVYTNNTNSCDDLNPCTSGDVCGPRFAENFDGVTAPALPSGWTSTQTGTGQAWATSSASSDTASNSALGFDGATVADEVLVSPTINIASASAKLTFRTRWSFEFSGVNCYDAGVLEISINGGAFTDIVTAGGSFASGGYTGTVSAGFSNPLGGKSAWCAQSTGYPGYLTVTVNLPAAAAGQPVQLRWRVGSDTSTGAAGQNVDTIAIVDPTNVCQGTSATNCDDGDACTLDTCDPQSGCVHTPIVCDDNNLCTTDSCNPATGCVYTPISCDDSNPCTDDSCNAETGCSYTNNTNPCDDLNACTSPDVCAGGVCTPGAGIICNDNNPCTDDSCSMATGCVYTPNTAPCSDNDACTTGDTCAGGLCQPGGPTVCNDGNVCTDDSCISPTGCSYVPNTASCSDGDACTENDTCSDGSCNPGTPVNCNDNDACTSESCDPQTGCVNTPIVCNDNNPCTDDSCDAQTGCVYTPNTAACDDGDACTANDTCGGGTCHGGPAVVCNDGNVCTTDSCNPASGCVYAPNTDPCDDGNACTTGDVCGGGTCHPGGPTNCDDGNVCTNDSCNPATGCEHANNTNPCDDGNACTTGDTCGGGSCQPGGPVNCDDSNPCTDDSCNPATGCEYANNTNPCNDGNACTTGDICGGGTCHAGAPADCNDNDACTADSCNPSTGCTHAPVNCDDGNVCTSDSCNPATGCVYVPVICNDSNACTSDACVPGIGCVFTPIVCNDGNVCTDDSCNPATGCVYTNNTASCDDGNACTVDVCSNGACGCPPVQACTPSSLHFDSTDVPKVISATGTPTVTSTVTVSGAGSYLRDLNVKTFITHTSTGQLQISIQSPAGTIVTLSSNNGAALDNLFNGTLWDDSADPANQAPFPGDTFAASNLVTDTVYTNLVPKTTLVPEEALGAFIGENPNGVWTLTIADQTAADGGSLANWSLDVATLAAAPTKTTVTYASTDVPKTIPTTAPPNVVTSNVTVASAGAQIGRVRLTTFIKHTFPGDIDMTLKSPSGRIVTITTDNAASNDDVFNGTLWDDKADPGNQVPYVVPFASSKMVTDAAYAINVVKVTLTSEEGLAAFVGENPNGVWTLTISDDANLDGGSLVNWSLEITTDDCTLSCNTNCDDGNVCTDDACDPQTGCYHTNNTGSCNDGNLCTTNDTCSGGSCAGSPVSCNDGNVCTDDSCNPANGLCVHGNNTNSCDDGNACTSGDVCGAPAVCGSTENFDGVTAPALPSGWTSTMTGTGTLWVTSAASSSSAPNSALGADGATVSDELLVSPPISITSATATLTFRNRWSFESATSCFDAGVLEIKIGAGSFTDIVTAGGSFGSGGYTGTVSSSFSNPLGGRSAWCNASAGYPAYTTTVVNLPAAAAGQTIQLRWRIGTDTSTGAAGQNIDTIVIGDTCAATCHAGSPVVCNDGNVCTDDSCNPATGCVYTNNTAPCDDGNACTTGDTCGGGSCQPGGPVVIPEVTNVLVDAGTVITWTSIPGMVYDIASGTTNDLQINGVVNATCLANDVGVATYTDVQPGPVPDDGFFYLIRAQNACGSGGYGFDSGGAPRTPTSACP